MTCRDEILACVQELVQRTGEEHFTTQDILDCMKKKGTQHKESTITTHITSRLCANAPNHHGTTYNDLERTDRGTYRLLRQLG